MAIQPETQDTVEGFYTYLLNQQNDLPVLSLVFEPGDYFWGTEVFMSKAQTEYQVIVEVLLIIGIKIGSAPYR